MNSRNYDNVPPLANNTVTISTTPQVRITTAGGQMRPMAVPMRPQPIPIRKLLHDSGGGHPSTSSSPGGVQFTTLHQIKEDPDALDFQTASTSSGPLIASSAASGAFQQYQRGNSTSSGPLGGPTSSGSTIVNNGSMAMDQPAPVNLASKVAEVFLTAGHAFQKLGDLTLQLHTTTDADESKWSEKEVDNLKNALTRFAHELDQISTCVASRTTKHIKNDIKRRHIMSAEDGPNPQIKRMTLGGGPSGNTSSATYTTINTGGMISSGHAVPLTQKRIGMQPMGKMMATRVVPTRYTVAPISGQSVVVSGTSSASASSSGMPQLQSQGGPGTSSHHQPPPQQRHVIATSSTTRVMAPMMGKLSGAVKQRGMTPTSGVLNMQPASGALLLEHND